MEPLQNIFQFWRLKQVDKSFSDKCILNVNLNLLTIIRKLKKCIAIYFYLQNVIKIVNFIFFAASNFCFLIHSATLGHPLTLVETQLCLQCLKFFRIAILQYWEDDEGWKSQKSFSGMSSANSVGWSHDPIAYRHFHPRRPSRTRNVFLGCLHRIAFRAFLIEKS